LLARQSGLLNRLPVQRGNTTTGTYIISTWPGLLHRPHAATRANVVFTGQLHVAIIHCWLLAIRRLLLRGNAALTGIE